MKTMMGLAEITKLNRRKKVELIPRFWVNLKICSFLTNPFFSFFVMLLKRVFKNDFHILGGV